MDNFYDAVVIGGGAAGLTAAIYLARARYRVLVVEKDRFGGQIAITEEVVNYPGVERIGGAALADAMRRQAQSFGAEFLLAEAEGLDLSGDVKKVRAGGKTLNCFGVLLATGAHPRDVGFAGEAEFRGRGVAYCATCDGEFFTGRDVFVVGGGFAAAEESVFLTKYARKVTILIRKPDFSCAKGVADAVGGNEKITVLRNTEMEEVSGDGAIRRVRCRNNVTGEVAEYRAPAGESFGVFVFAGRAPATALVGGVAELDPHGYVKVDQAQRTSVEGLYAAGDVCAKTLRQVATAVGDGALAATGLERLAAALQEKTGLRPELAATRFSREEPAPSAAPSPTGLFTGDMRAQLAGLFGKMARPLLLRLFLDGRPVSAELREFMEGLAGLTDKLTLEIAPAGETEPFPPCARVCLADGADCGMAFHGVPGGHEFTSFALALYNASGPGQPLDPEIAAAVRAIDRPVSIKILVSLSCAICPDTVRAAQRLAAENPLIRADAYDLNHFPDLRDRYNVMSVPCVIVDDGPALFGGKTARQLLEALG